MKRQRTLTHALARLLLALIVLMTTLGAAPPRQALAQEEPLTLTVTIEHVRGLDCADPAKFIFDWGCESDPDMYAIVSLDGVEHPKSPTIDNTKDIRPEWSFSTSVVDPNRLVPVQVTIWDDDNGPLNNNDKLDLKPAPGRDLMFTVNPRSCAVLGDLTGGCWRPLSSEGTEEKRARIQVRIDVNLPRTVFWGNIFDGAPPERAQPIEGQRVRLIEEATNLEIAATSTDRFGTFRIETRPLPGQTMRLEVAPCEGVIICEHFDPDVAQIDIAPLSTSPRVITFPGCPPDGFCRYSPVDFFLRRDLASVPPVSLDSASPEQPTPPTILRSEPLKQTDAQVTLLGEGMHSWLQPYFVPADCSDMLVCGYPAPLLSVSADGGSAQVNVPPAILDRGLASFQQRWYWGLRNPLVVGTPTEMLTLAPTHLNFAAIHGFSFENERDKASYDEFKGVYGNNATICLGAFGKCITRIPDPMYSIYYEAAYKSWASGDGSCVGMAATSLRMATSPAEYPPQRFFDQAYFANGLPGLPENNQLPPKPARFDPRNLWGEIRVNHGVQTSAEYINERLDDIRGTDRTKGNPNARLAELRANPFANLLCLRANNNSGGHCVTPYAVEDISPTVSRIWIYDNNFPENPYRYVDIDQVSNHFTLPGYDNYDGQGITTYPIEIWARPRHMPGLGEGLRYVLAGIFGSSQALFHTADGRWGYEADGSFVETLPGAVDLSPANAIGDSTQSLPLYLPLDGPVPTVDVRMGDDPATLFAIQDGLLATMPMPNGLSGTTSTIALAYGSERLAGFDFTVPVAVNEIAPTIGLAPTDNQRAVFSWAGLDVSAGGSVGFSGERDQYQVAYRNGTAATTEHTLVLEHVDGEAEVTGKRFFGPFKVPAGATQRATIIDWPAATQLRIELDRNGDGIMDHSEIVRGVVAGERAVEGLQALYTFEAGTGAVVPDVAGVAEALDLGIGNLDANSWRADGLAMMPDTTLQSIVPATRLNAALSATNEVTLEAWVTPDVATLTTGGSLVALGGAGGPTLTLLQGQGKGTRSDQFSAAIATDTSTQPEFLHSKSRSVAPTLTHLVLTRDSAGSTRLYLNGALQRQRTVPGGLSSMDTQALLVLANSVDGSQAWTGVYHLLAIYNRALSPAEVAENMGVGPREDGFAPATQIQSLYTFEEQSGAVVHDVGRTGLPHHLNIPDESAVRWTDGGLELIQPTMISSAQTATKLSDAAADSGEVTIEVWARPQSAIATQTGRMVSISSSPTRRNISLTQGKHDRGGRYVVRLNTTRTAPDGWATWAPLGSATATLSHIVYTRDRLGLTRLYVNGVEVAREEIPGALTSWDAAYQLALGNDFTGDRAWLGEYQRVALYNRALSPAEVTQHFGAGATDTP